MITQIVANSLVLKHFSSIDIFKLELGKNLTGPVGEKGKDGIKIKISDDFIKKYQTLTGQILFKYGSIGKLTFYLDSTLKNNEFVAFDGDKIYEIDIEDITELMNAPRQYLSKVISKIENTNEVEYHQLEISTVPKEIETPDISLPHDQYIEKMIQRRNMMSGIEPDNEKAKNMIDKKRQEYYGI